MKLLLVGAIALCAFLYELAALRGHGARAGRWRMATVLLIATLAARALPGHPAPAFAWPVAAGLFVSLAGDLCFALPRERFVPGLVAYMIGHLCYIGAMVAAGALSLLPTMLVPFLLMLTLMLIRQVSAGMREHGRPDLVAPAYVYAGVLTTMLWLALSTVETTAPLPFAPALVATAGVCYYFADGVMVWHRFIHPVRYQPLLEMGAYFAAQLLFAISVAWPVA